MLCKDCLEEKQDTEFCKNKSKKTGFNSTCKECQKLKSKAHYLKNKSMYFNRNKNRQKEVVDFIESIKKNSCCPFCSESEPCCLDFHHIKGEDKIYNIATMMRRYTLSSVKKEVEKCSIICANCHRKLHHGTLKLSNECDGLSQ